MPCSANSIQPTHEPEAGEPLTMSPGPFSFWRADFMASIVVFLVALPLSMGVAVASGVDPARGLITGIIGGIVVGLLAGAPLQVSGPAAGLFVIVYQLVDSQRIAFLAPHGDLSKMADTARQAVESQATEHAMLALGAAVLICGAVQLLSGLLKLGQWFRAVSPAVIYGMLAGIGVLILASQFHVMIDDAPRGRGLDNLLTIPHAIAKAVSPDTGKTHHLAAMIGVLTIVTLLAWQKLTPAKLRIVPASLVAVIVASVTAALVAPGVLKIQVPTNLMDEMSFPNSTSLQLLMSPSILTAGLVLAAIASAETLLCTTALDQLHHGPRAKYDRELAAQGVGNLLCGLLGTLPMTGVIVRSSTNVQAGGRTRLSTILHGGWLLLFVVALPQVMGFVPKSCLGAILVYTGFKLVDIKAIKKLAQYGRSELAIYAATLAVIVAKDLLVGVLVGLALAAAKLLYTVTHLDQDLTVADGGRTATLKLRGAATFIRLPQLAMQLKQVPRGAALHVDFEHLDYIDHACLDLLMNWARQHESVGGTLHLDWDSLHAKFHTEKPRVRRHLHDGGTNGPPSNGSQPGRQRSAAVAEGAVR